MAMVDTDVLIDLLRKHQPTLNWLATLTEPVEVPVFVAMELFEGCHNKAQMDGVRKVLKPFGSAWPSASAASTAALQYSTLKLSHGIGLLDCLIACCAVERGTTLYTFNIKHYSAYPGLIAKAPYKKP